MAIQKINPFFIVGCMRTGTTLLRNVLRTYPSLICPEETQFYRWSHTYNSNAFTNTLLKNKVFKLHRKIDGVSEETMKQILQKSFNRKQLMLQYIAAFAKAKEIENYNWFDKSPQNILGLLQLMHDFPNSKIVINFRDPIEVLASLKRGKVVKITNFKLAVNTWLESNKVAAIAKSKFKNRIYLLNYENLTSHTEEELNKICAFLDLDFNLLNFDLDKIFKKEYPLVFTEHELKIIARYSDNLFIRLQNNQN